MILNTIFYVVNGITVLVSCIPREKIWNPTIPGTCLHNDLNLVISAAFNCTLDFLIFLLPIYAIVRLQIRVKQKFGIGAVFAVGLL